MSSNFYKKIEMCYERNLTHYECYDVLADEYTTLDIPPLETIRRIYREIEETYDRF